VVECSRILNDVPYLRKTYRFRIAIERILCSSLAANILQLGTNGRLLSHVYSLPLSRHFIAHIRAARSGDFEEGSLDLARGRRWGGLVGLEKPLSHL